MPAAGRLMGHPAGIHGRSSACTVGMYTSLLEPYVGLHADPLDAFRSIQQLFASTSLL